MVILSIIMPVYNEASTLRKIVEEVPEITAKLARIKNIRKYDVGISYFGRKYDEGKKITWRDGVSAIWCIVRYRFFR